MNRPPLVSIGAVDGGVLTASARIVVTGAAGRVGRRVCALLADAYPDIVVVAVDVRSVDPPVGAQFVKADLATVDLADLLDGATVVIHLASLLRADDDDDSDGHPIDLTVTRRLLDAARTVEHMILVSSAMVYGAWSGNSIPLTEDAPMRPNPEYPFAVRKAEMERIGLEWRIGQPDRALTVLRPTVTVAEGERGGLARVLADAAVVRTDEGDAPVQFLHADDLATAVIAAVEHRVDGVLNVAPDGWIQGDEFRALMGPKPRLRLGANWARSVLLLRRRVGIGASPPGLVPYTTYPWAVANDRLKALGWQETSSNAEAYVAAFDPGPLDRLTARRRQEIALGVMVAALVGLGIAAVIGVRRLRRR